MIELPLWLFLASHVAFGMICVGLALIALLAWVGWKWGSEP